MAVKKRIVFEVGGWTVDSLAQSISNGGEEHHLPGKVMAVLVVLAQNHGQLVTRQELIDLVWDGNSFVGEKTLTNAVWRIRQALDSDSGDEEIIKTTPKIGYQLLLTPRFQEVDEDSPRPMPLARQVVRLTSLLLAALGVGAVGVWYFSDPPVSASVTPLAVVTHLPGRELYAAPAPDGSRFAFMHVSSTGAQELYTQSLTELDGQPVRFTNKGTSNYSPSWAPDSRHLAYVRIDDKSGVCQIVVRDMQLAEDWPVAVCAATAQKTLSWSPNGNWLVYRKPDAVNGPGLFLKAMPADFRADEKSRDKRISCADCLLVDQEVSWSPDSNSLAVTRTRNAMSEDVHRFDLDTWAFSNLTSGESSIEGHTWDREGENLLYVSDKHSLNRRLWVINLLSKNKHEIGYEGAGFPVYLPDYRSIMFYQRRAQAYIAVVALDGDDSTLRFPKTVVQTSGSERSPEFSEEANKLAYYSNVSGYNEIWIADPDGSNRQQLTDLKTEARYPSWSPSGDKIAFIAFDPYTQSTTIRYYDFATDSVHLLTSKFDDNGAPTWASDGQSLIVPSWVGPDSVDLWRISIDGNSISRLTTHGANFGRESADGRTLYYSKIGKRGLFSISLHEIEPRESRVIRDMVTRGFGNWGWASPTRILYSRHLNDHSEIVEYDLETDSKTIVLKHPPNIVHRSGMLSFSQSHNLLYFTHREPQQIDIMMAPDPLVTHSARR